MSLSMAQRYVQLENSCTGNADGSATIHFSQLPPTHAILAPGPALMYVPLLRSSSTNSPQHSFVVVDGVPSIVSSVMVGNGALSQPRRGPR